MSQKPISLSTDLKRLHDNGYEVEIKGGYVLIHHVPYLNTSREVKYGTLASVLNLAGDITTRPQDHTVYFCGEHPCTIHGHFISGIVNSSGEFTLGEGITAQHYLSSKPPEGYPDYYEKFTSYIRIISSHAQEIDHTATAQTYAPIESDEHSVFNYVDTNTSRANIFPVSRKLEGQKIAIIGVGGTGSYILDLIAKTPVAEIHLYDDDMLLTHNAFRSPGAPAIEELRKLKRKTEYFTEIYQRMHKNIISHEEKVSEDNVHQLLAYDFVFVSIDSGSARKIILHYLMKNGKPFIDVGIDVRIVDESLIGQVRTTLGKHDHYDHLSRYVPYADRDNDDYNSNIQIAELNALNATMAVIKWKQMCGFYKDLYQGVNSTYTIYNGGLSHAYKEE
jgi:molybdopterin/thiamine biosynthesis adenylyltransferase